MSLKFRSRGEILKRAAKRHGHANAAIAEPIQSGGVRPTVTETKKVGPSCPLNPRRTTHEVPLSGARKPTGLSKRKGRSEARKVPPRSGRD